MFGILPKFYKSHQRDRIGVIYVRSKARYQDQVYELSMIRVGDQGMIAVDQTTCTRELILSTVGKIHFGLF